MSKLDKLIESHFTETNKNLLKKVAALDPQDRCKFYEVYCLDKAEDAAANEKERLQMEWMGLVTKLGSYALREEASRNDRERSVLLTAIEKAYEQTEEEPDWLETDNKEDNTQTTE